MSLTAVYEPVENGWTQARIEELPAVITAAPTKEALDAQQTYLEVTGPSSPGILRPASGPNGYLHVIMPMHVAR